MNTHGTIDDVDEEMKEFPAYVGDTTDAFAEQAGSQLVRDIHTRVKWIRTDRRTEVKYMALYMHDLDVRRDALEEGRAEGREQGQTEGRQQEKEGNIARMAEYIMEMFPEIELSGGDSVENLRVIGKRPTKKTLSLLSDISCWAQA